VAFSFNFWVCAAYYIEGPKEPFKMLHIPELIALLIKTLKAMLKQLPQAKRIRILEKIIDVFLFLICLAAFVLFTQAIK